MRFEVFCDNSGRWRWRMVAPNGRIIADSGKGYVNKFGARRAAEHVADEAAEAEIIEVTE